MTSERYVNFKISFQLTCVTCMSLFLIACGGSGETSNALISPTMPTPQIDNRWVLGVFDDESLLKDNCEVPRNGIDNITGEAYPDIVGNSIDEMLWLRSWTNDTYLWFDEVDDNDPVDFSVADYFDQLKTNFRTNSGTFKDNFHFSQSTEEYLTRTQGGITFGYGISWEFIRATAPRSIIVRYTEPDSPADLAGITRGDELLFINTIDFINTQDSDDVSAINAALFPSSTGQSANFTLLKQNGAQTRYQLSARDVALSPVQNSKVLTTDIGQIGYMQFNSHIQSAQRQLISAITLFSQNNIQALVIDMRYNGGGLLSMASQLAFMVTGSSQTDALTFNQLQFNGKHPTFNPITGQRLQATPFYGREIDYNQGVFTANALPSLGLSTVYVLSSSATCSASEAFINGLIGIDIEVVLIGDTTCGKPYGFYPQDNCGTTYFTIQFQGSNQKGFGEYSDGFIPTPVPLFDADVQGCMVEDDFQHSMGDRNEGMLSAAVNHIQTGECPVEPAAKRLSTQISSEQGLRIRTSSSIIDAIILENTINHVITEPK